MPLEKEDYEKLYCIADDCEERNSKAIRKLNKAMDMLKIMRPSDDDYGFNEVFGLVETAQKKVLKNSEKIVSEIYKHRPRDLRLGDAREAEMKELVRRMDQLPDINERDVDRVATELGLAKMNGDNKLRSEIFELLKTEPVSCIASYCYLAHRGKVQLVKHGASEVRSEFSAA